MIKQFFTKLTVSFKVLVAVFLLTASFAGNNTFG
jgi:hypothetical protein